jgi:hypothetical protein
MLGAFLGGLTFVAVFFIGLFGGVSFFSLLLRGLISGVILSAAGVGLGALLEHLAPGAWEAGAEGSGEKQYEGVDGIPLSAGGSSFDGAGAGSLNLVVGEDDTAPGRPPIDLPDGTDAPRAHSAPPPGSRQQRGDGKVVGNVRVIGDAQFPDIPEDYAKAVRTMMIRDD